MSAILYIFFLLTEWIRRNSFKYKLEWDWW